MPKHYAALKMKMGEWDYYVVRMRMADIAAEIKFASEVNDDRTLDEAIQRELNEGRANTQIVRYLQSNPQRFFGSIVVAALEGNPRWFSVGVEDDPRFEMVGADIADTFGVLLFDDTIKTYALDGQHRLSAIKVLVEGQAEVPAPQGFSEETVSVIFVIQPEGSTREAFLKSYRRLFSSLNRHAKPTAPNTNIIMDEDDRFAILTRRILSEFDFFSWDGTEGMKKVDTSRASENLTSAAAAFMTIVGLYKMNARLLWTQDMMTQYGSVGSGSGWKELIQDTPDDEEIDTVYEGLENIWDGILLTLPDLNNEPITMRNHNHEYGDEDQDHLLFWPIGQTALLAPLVRRLLDVSHIDLPTDSKQVETALSPLKVIPWDLKHDLWRDFLLVWDPAADNWKMRNEDRPNCLKIAISILYWVTGLETLDQDSLDDMKVKWASALIPPGDNQRETETFDQLESIRESILDG